jgi:uncharacterized membrane protein YdjX (TVP38/TMEM64 family)
MITSLRPRTAFALWVLVVLVALVAGRALDAPALLVRALEWIRELGPLGPVIFVLLYVLATVLFLPGSILSLGAGAVFGVVTGVIMVSVSATLGATAAFLIGRYLAREWVTQKVQGHSRFAALDDAVALEGWKIVALMRLSPVIPFNLLNYVFGVTRVRLRDYVLASCIGMLPGTIMYVYLGSLIGDLATLSAGARTRSAAEWAFYVVGLLATVAVTIYVTRVARAALRKRVAV